MLAVRRVAGGASYATYDPGERPWHSAVAAMYAQATAPLRRLQDRYVIEAAPAVAAGRSVPDDVSAAFDVLPQAMARVDRRANRAERQALDLVEAVCLRGREGELVDAVVIDEVDWGARCRSPTRRCSYGSARSGSTRATMSGSGSWVSIWNGDVSSSNGWLSTTGAPPSVACVSQFTSILRVDEEIVSYTNEVVVLERSTPMLPYPYTDLADSRRRDYERRATAHRFAAALTRHAHRRAK